MHLACLCLTVMSVASAGITCSARAYKVRVNREFYNDLDFDLVVPAQDTVRLTIDLLDIHSVDIRL